MSDWALHIPYHSRGQPLNAETIWTLSKQLDGEDRQVTRELLIVLHRAGVRTLGQAIDDIECLDATDRRLFIDGARRLAGLPLTKEVDDSRALELAQSASKARGNSLLQYCAHCNATPVTESGSLAETRARNWHCPEHRHLAGPTDMLDRPPPWMYASTGAIIEAPDETEISREAEAAASRARAREAQIPDRELEAAQRRKHQAALAEEARRLTPAGVWAPPA